ncbi:MAG: hypothetical protein ACI909_002828 [Planctomycetota bacterium]|jgi:hypothetical protein
MLTWETIFILVLIILIASIWFESLRVREFVIKHCHHLCREINLQLLDQTVSLTSLSLRRTDSGSLGFKRKYQFEVSENGADRFSGYITLVGNRIIESRLEGPDGQNIFHQGKPSTLH